MIGRADIEGSKSDVAMGAWPPQASSFIPLLLKGISSSKSNGVSMFAKIRVSQLDRSLFQVGVARTLGK